MLFRSVVRSQSVLEGVYEDMLAEEETADQEWPGVMEGAEVSEQEEMNESDGNDSITKGMFGPGRVKGAFFFKKKVLQYTYLNQ